MIYRYIIHIQQWVLQKTVVKFDMGAFQVDKDGRTLDYRTPGVINFEEVRTFFSKTYTVKKLWQSGRHVLGILDEEDEIYFLKLATSEGISVLTHNECEWNKQVSPQAVKSPMLRIPRVFASGFFKENLFYMLTEYFEGNLLCSLDGTKEKSDALLADFDHVIACTKLIEGFTFTPQNNPYSLEKDHRAYFESKVRAWFEGIPQGIRQSYRVDELLSIAISGKDVLEKRTRHGDFTPWHIMRLPEGTFGLLDGEHALPHGVEYYDVAYFIQRVFVVLKNPEAATQMIGKLLEDGFDKQKLRTVLAARAIGGYLDTSLDPNGDYSLSDKLQKLIASL